MILVPNLSRRGCNIWLRSGGLCRNLAENVLPKQPPRFCVIISMASREIGLFRRLKTTEGVVLHSFLYKHNRGKECSLNLLCVQMTRTSWTNVSTAEPSTTHLPWPLSSWHYRAWMTSACVCVCLCMCALKCASSFCVVLGRIPEPLLRIETGSCLVSGQTRHRRAHVSHRWTAWICGATDF